MISFIDALFHLFHLLLFEFSLEPGLDLGQLVLLHLLVEDLLLGEGRFLALACDQLLLLLLELLLREDVLALELVLQLVQLLKGQHVELRVEVQSYYSYYSNSYQETLETQHHVCGYCIRQRNVVEYR